MKSSKNAWIPKIHSHKTLETSSHYKNVALTSTSQLIEAHEHDLEVKQFDEEKSVENIGTKNRKF